MIALPPTVSRAIRAVSIAYLNDGASERKCGDVEEGKEVVGVFGGMLDGLEVRSWRLTWFQMRRRG